MKVRGCPANLRNTDNKEDGLIKTKERNKRPPPPPPPSLSLDVLS